MSEQRRVNLLEELTQQAYVSDYPPTAERTELRAKWWVSSVIVATILTLLITVGLTSTRTLAVSQQTQRHALIDRIRAQENSVSELAATNASDRVKIKMQSQAQLAESQTGRTLLSELAQARVAAGATAVTARGVCITLRQASESAFLTDRDLQGVVNMLWRSGAYAVAVNNERLNSRSAIRSAGGAILVGYRPIAMPYRTCAVAKKSFVPASFSALLSHLQAKNGVESQTVMQVVTLPAAQMPK